MPISKQYISSPLEAGPSLLDIKQLPPQLLSALDYVSKRLARKRLHISLIVVRKDINIPGIPLSEPPKAPEPRTPSVTISPKAFFSNASSTFARTNSNYGLSLLHMSTLTEKAEKILRATIAKAENKFPIG
jgi:hypothetical protein